MRDEHICHVLADCWERTKDMMVPLFREGECEVRALWDEAVAEAMDWNPRGLEELRRLLNNEPRARGLAYNQYADEADIELDDRELFQQLADQWEEATVLLSSSSQATEHPAYQEIASMGQAAVSLILERMQSHSGHWLQALYDITGANPVDPLDYGNIEAMEAAWQEWGKLNGFA